MELNGSEQRYEALLEELSREFPRFRLVRKPDSRTQRIIHYGLIGLTFGQMRDYLDNYHTTVGQTVYVTGDWANRDPDSRYITLRHERVHMRQFRRFTLLGMAVLYLLVPLPIGLAYFRARFEKEAYAESMRAACELHGRDHIEADRYRERILRQFCGPSYLWMWPFRGHLNRWYDSILAEIPT